MGVSEPIFQRRLVHMSVLDVPLMWCGFVLWIVAFLLGTFVNSSPYREGLATFEGGLTDVLTNVAIVIVTYTHTNVLLLCTLAGLLGTLGARAGLGVDNDPAEPTDTTSPRNSAVLRAFLVYLLVLSGLLILGDDPATPSQRQYVRLAGFISVLGFIVNYRPALFAGLLHRAGDFIEGGKK